MSAKKGNIIEMLNLDQLPPEARECFLAISSVISDAVLLGGLQAITHKDGEEAAKHLNTILDDLRKSPVYAPTALLTNIMVCGSVLQLWEARFNQLDPETARGMATALKELGRSARGMMKKR